MKLYFLGITVEKSFINFSVKDFYMNFELWYQNLSTEENINHTFEVGKS